MINSIIPMSPIRNGGRFFGKTMEIATESVGDISIRLSDGGNFGYLFEIIDV